MTVSEAKDMDILFARLDDLCGAAMQGDLAATSFLSPRELYFLDKYLKELKCKIKETELSWDFCDEDPTV